MKRFFREIFSDKGYYSSKRVFSAVMILAVVFVVVYFTLQGTCNDCVKDLAQLLLLISATLLGVSNVTNIWKNKGNNNNKPDNKEG